MKKIRFTILLFLSLLKRYNRRAVLSKRNYIAEGKKIRSFLVHQKLLLLVPVAFILLFFLGKIVLNYYSQPAVSEGVIGVYTTSNLPLMVTNLISEPLVILDKTGSPQPKLVSGWQVNNNATVYTFKLRDNLYWNDGTKIKSSEIKFNLPDVEVSYPDDQTLEFKLADSFNPFPTLLTAPVFKNNSLVGVGKYKVSFMELSRGLITKLVLSPDRKKIVAENWGLPVIRIRFYPDEKTAKTAFEIGEIESLISVSEDGDFEDQPSINVKTIPNFSRIVAIFYNTKDPILSDKTMRRALSYASPKIEGEERAMTSISSRSWAYNDQIKDMLADPELVKTQLAKVQNGKDSTITLTTTPALSSLGEKIIQSWKQSGINAVLRIESGMPQNFQALLVSEPIPLDPDQYALWHSTQTKTNISKYSSPRIDKDLEDGRKIGDLEKRKEKYADFQKILLDDSPATFLYFPKSNIIYRKKAENDLNKILDLQIPQI